MGWRLDHLQNAGSSQALPDATRSEEGSCRQSRTRSPLTAYAGRIVSRCTSGSIRPDGTKMTSWKAAPAAGWHFLNGLLAMEPSIVESGVPYGLLWVSLDVAAGYLLFISWRRRSRVEAMAV